MPIQIKNNQTTIGHTACGDRTHIALASKILKKEGPQGFQGGISPANYRKIAGVSEVTATRNLVDMLEVKVFIHLGEKRYTRYDLNLKIHLVQKVTVSD